MKVLLYTSLIILSSCATTKQTKDPLQTRVEALENEVKNLRDGQQSHSFMISHDQCFIEYHTCLLEEKFTKKKCWNIHEQCVIFTYKMYKGGKK